MVISIRLNYSRRQLIVRAGVVAFADDLVECVRKTLCVGEAVALRQGGRAALEHHQFGEQLLEAGQFGLDCFFVCPN